MTNLLEKWVKKGNTFGGKQRRDAARMGEGYLECGENRRFSAFKKNSGKAAMNRRTPKSPRPIVASEGGAMRCQLQKKNRRKRRQRRERNGEPAKFYYRMEFAKCDVS
jgi:hypothetical protein